MALIEIKGLTKRFGNLVANDHIDMTFESGQVIGIVGENGAGKSTLMNMLYGYVMPDSGEILIQGQSVVLKSPQDAMKQGIGMVHQHFMLVEALSVWENIVLGAEKSFFLSKDRRDSRQKIQQLMDKFNLQVNLDAVVEDLSVGEKQRVEILKALYRNARVLILDEPSAVLTPQEVEGLAHLIRDLKAQGHTVLLITHKLKEILEMTDVVYVMRLGKKVAFYPTAEVTE